MKVGAIGTIRLTDRPNLLLRRAHPDEETAGLGEIYRGAQAGEAQIHQLVAPLSSGQCYCNSARSRSISCGWLVLAPVASNAK